MYANHNIKDSPTICLTYILPEAEELIIILIRIKQNEYKRFT